jgi:AraC family transcriptional regulator
MKLLVYRQMRTAGLNPEYEKDLSVRAQQLQEKIARARPRTPQSLTIEGVITRPDFQIEVRRYFWETPIEPTLVSLELCYLESALTLRPSGSEIDYLNRGTSDGFVSTGNSSFIPAKQQALVRGSQGEQLVVGCLFEPSVFEPYRDWEWSPLELAACFNINNIDIRAAMVRLAQEATHPGHCSAALVDGLFQYLLVELSRHIRANRKVKTNTSGNLSSHQLKLIETAVTQADHEFPHTATLAELCGISPRHLARMFKNTKGMTLTDYITEARVNRAKTLLNHSDLQIKEIAYQCGFQCPSSFAHVFRKACGSTPRQYRQSAGAGNIRLPPGHTN